ncbi:MAG: hypothetical protein FJX25_17325 [Alphaproteobacteria bacterium]|nr:hypothetical protein [Alphaproteobacteria bacterium]
MRLARCDDLPNRSTAETPSWHQRTYDLAGQVLDGRDRGPSFDPSRYSLKLAHCMNLTQIPPVLNGLSVYLMRHVAPSGLAEARIVCTSAIAKKGNWKLVMENDRDCFHCGVRIRLSAGAFPAIPCWR